MVGGLSKQIYLPNELTQQLGYFRQEGLDSALQNQMAIFSPDGLMPADAPQTVLNIEYQNKLIPQSKTIDLSLTYTNEFASQAS